jgi:hypothetical protein
MPWPTNWHERHTVYDFDFPARVGVVRDDEIASCFAGKKAKPRCSRLVRVADNQFPRGVRWFNYLLGRISASNKETAKHLFWKGTNGIPCFTGSTRPI